MAAMVAPTSGIRSSRPTNTASASAYGMPTIRRKMYDVRAAMKATVERTADEAADPREDLVGQQLDPLAPGGRDQPVGLPLHARQRGEEVERQDQHGDGAEHRTEHDAADAEDSAEEPLSEVARLVT